MMPTLDDRNKPIDPFNTRKSIDDCSGEEWDAASRAYWAKTSIDKELYEEDPVYSKDCLFDGGSLIREDKIIKDEWLDLEEEDTLTEQYSETYKMIEDEETFEQIVQIMGPWEAISFCHGTALVILMDKDNFTNSTSIEKAKVYLSRMARLINETKECNW